MISQCSTLLTFYVLIIIITFTQGYYPESRITWGQGTVDDIYFLGDNGGFNTTAIVGDTATLPCRVANIRNHDVTWIRKRDLHILTVGVYTYTTDERFKVIHNEGDSNWNLQIFPVKFRDEGLYECQVAISPKLSLPRKLTVEVQQARISGSKEMMVQLGSTINLFCEVNAHFDNVGQLHWYRNSKPVSYDSPRGGVSLEIEKTPRHTTSKLLITRATPQDSGNYTCKPQRAISASVMVHVVNGEESAAVYGGAGGCQHQCSGLVVTLLQALVLLLPMFCLDHR